VDALAHRHPATPLAAAAALMRLSGPTLVQPYRYRPGSTRSVPARREHPLSLEAAATLGMVRVRTAGPS